jgi:hypothetical protein
MSVSCSSPGNCTAVGDADVGDAAAVSSIEPIAVTEANGVWGGLVLFPVGIKVAAEWNSVSCTSVGNCVAVGGSGEFGGAGVHSPVYATETNGVWSSAQVFPAASNASPDAPASSMYSVDCPSLGNCVAVGQVGYAEFPIPSPPTGGSYAIETNGVWGPDTIVPQTPAALSWLVGVSCVAVNFCYAVGTNSTNQPIAVVDTSGTWGAAKVLNIDSNVTSISCSPSNICTAVGDGTYDVENGGVWDTFALPGAALDMSSISCTDATDCTAVGSNGYVTEAGGVWGSPTGISGFPVGTESMASVSCADATDCTAVGYDEGNNVGLSRPFYVMSAVPPTPPVVVPPPPVLPTPPVVVPPPPANPTPPVTTPTPSPVVTSPSTSASHGYWLVGSDGGIFTYGDAAFYGSTGSLRLQRPVVGITPTAGDLGYWLVASDGGIFSFGDAGFYGSIPGLGIAPYGSGLPHALNAPIIGMVPSADGGGYFMVGADGGVFTFGDAKFEGSCPGIGGCPGGAAVAVVPDGTGNGYWVVTQGGYVIPFGDAPSPGEPAVSGVVAAVRSFDGGGYYLLYANGVVYSAGDAVNYGSAVNEVGGFNPASAIFTTSDGGGYWIASANGSVITEGDAPYEGGANTLHLNGAIIAGTGW